MRKVKTSGLRVVRFALMVHKFTSCMTRTCTDCRQKLKAKRESHLSVTLFWQVMVLTSTKQRIKLRNRVTWWMESKKDGKPMNFGFMIKSKSQSTRINMKLSILEKDHASSRYQRTWPRFQSKTSLQSNIDITPTSRLAIITNLWTHNLTLSSWCWDRWMPFTCHGLMKFTRIFRKVICNWFKIYRTFQPIQRFTLSNNLALRGALTDISCPSLNTD